MKYNSLFLELESSSNSGHDYNTRGRKLDALHFRIFGAFVYIHVSKESRKKLEPTTELGVFLGYIETPQNYHVYLPSLKMTVV